MVEQGRTWGASLAVTVLALMGASPVAAQMDAGQPPSRNLAAGARQPLAALVQDLDAEDVRKRLAAAQQLQDRADIRLRDLERVLERNDLSAEQRRRLLGVAEWRFRTEPRAALGFQGRAIMGDRSGQGVVIENVIAGFPSTEVLRAGDRIISADGLTLPNFASIRPVIVSRDPGDKLQLVIVRDGATMNVTVELGGFGQLPQGNNLDDGVLTEAWQMRSERLLGPRAEPVPSGLASDRWIAEGLELADLRTMEVMRTLGPDDGRLGVVMGGEPRGGVDRSLRRALEFPDVDALRPELAADPQVQHFFRLQQIIAQWETQRQAIDRMLADTALPAEQRQSLEQSRNALSQAIANQEAEMKRLYEELLNRR